MIPIIWTELQKKLPFALEQRAVRQFGLILSGLLLVTAVWQGWRGSGWWWLILLLSGGFGLGAITLTKVLWIIYIPWMLVARIISLILTHLLLTVVFYTMFTLVGLFLRLGRRDPLRLKLESESYWINRSTDDENDLTRMF